MKISRLQQPLLQKMTIRLKILSDAHKTEPVINEYSDKVIDTEISVADNTENTRAAENASGKCLRKLAVMKIIMKKLSEKKVHACYIWKQIDQE